MISTMDDFCRTVRDEGGIVLCEGVESPEKRLGGN